MHPFNPLSIHLTLSPSIYLGSLLRQALDAGITPGIAPSFDSSIPPSFYSPDASSSPSFCSSRSEVIPSSIHLLIHLYPSAHSSIHLLLHPFIYHIIHHPSAHLLIYACPHPFIHWFTHHDIFTLQPENRFIPATSSSWLSNCCS